MAKSGKQKQTFGSAKRGNLFLFQPEDLVIITDPKHPLYDPRVERPLTETFIKSLMRKGIIQPISVRKDGQHGEVVAGRRRVRGIIEANKRLEAAGKVTHLVPAVTRKDTDVEAYETAIEENEHREGDSPYERAEKAKRLLEHNRSEEYVADTFGVTVQTVKVWTGLWDLHPKVIESVEKDKIGLVDAVRKLGTIPRADQVKALADIMASGGASGAEGTARVRKAVEQRGGNAGAKPLPGKKQLKKIVEIDREGEKSVLTRREQILLEWVTGEASEPRAAEHIPGFVPLLRLSERKKEKVLKPKKEKTARKPKKEKAAKAA